VTPALPADKSEPNIVFFCARRTSETVEKIAIEIAGPVVDSDRVNIHILLAINYLTNFQNCIPSPPKGMKNGRRPCGNLCRFEVMKEPHSNKRGNFENKQKGEVLERLWVSKIRRNHFTQSRKTLWSAT
jgi:hypothetical protein